MSFSNHDIKDKLNRNYYLISQKYEKQTWEEAAELCERTIGGYLPWFGDRGNLDELLSFLKTSKGVPPIEAIYIGLKFNTSEVSNMRRYQ